jgi:Tfp pilus assembly protein PilE
MLPSGILLVITYKDYKDYKVKSRITTVMSDQNTLNKIDKQINK